MQSTVLSLDRSSFSLGLKRSCTLGSHTPSPLEAKGWLGGCSSLDFKFRHLRLTFISRVQVLNLFTRTWCSSRTSTAEMLLLLLCKGAGQHFSGSINNSQTINLHSHIPQTAQTEPEPLGQGDNIYSLHTLWEQAQNGYLGSSPSNK